ncbi:GntR family transcriptional regulator [Roseovarius aestuarii]|nr:GntR family transcriptional regulator [Roseovarius aestuarii]
MADFAGRVRPIHKETLQNEVYRQLCELILEGGLAPGESITVASIADAFNVSPMPVREALTRLMQAGALTIISGRSIGVPTPDLASFEDLKNVRIEVESIALRWAIRHKTPSFTASLEGYLEQMIQAEEAKDLKAHIRTNYEFHFAIYRQSGSRILLETIENLWLRVGPYFHALRERGNLRISNVQHRCMYQAIIDGDEAAATAALAHDIAAAYDTMVATLLGAPRS